MKVGALYVGVAAKDEGWTLSHDTALRKVKESLPFVEALETTDLVSPGGVSPKIDALVANGAKVVFATSFSHAKEVVDGASKYPGVTFLTCSGNVSNGKNLGSYFGRMEQAWYVAGKLAGGLAKSRLGYLGSYITPEVVRHLNAFALGAQHAGFTGVVEVRWLGFWFDWKTDKVPCKYGVGAKCSREEWHTEQLIESGAEIIAHQIDNGAPVRFIESYNAKKPAGAASVYSIGNDVRYGCKQDNKSDGKPYESCLYSVYWNWEPVYAKLLTDIHYKRWAPGALNDNVLSDATLSVANIEPNLALVGDTAIRNAFSEVAGQPGVSRAFEGPYETTGQRAAVASGERPSDKELASMCWIVKGVVERSDPDDVKSAERPALAPDAIHPLLPSIGVIGPPGAPDNVAHDCTENGPPTAP